MAKPRILLVIGKIEQTPNQEEKFKLLTKAERILAGMKDTQGRFSRIKEAKPNTLDNLIDAAEQQLNDIYTNMQQQ